MMPFPFDENGVIPIDEIICWECHHLHRKDLVEGGLICRHECHKRFKNGR